MVDLNAQIGKMEVEPDGVDVVADGLWGGGGGLRDLRRELSLVHIW